MSEILPQSEQEKQHYLRHGKLTEPSAKIKQLAKDMPDQIDDFVDEFKSWKSSRIGVSEVDNQEDWNRLFRKRTASEIVDAAYQNPDDHTGTIGCTDDAHVFLTFAREKGFPAQYIEAIKKDSKDGSEGHVFVRVFENGEWKVIDPAAPQHERGWNFDDYDVIAVGLDAADVGTDSEVKLKEKVEVFRN